ncbi:hypothetical protein AB0L44_38345 [Nonomuraea wenchangensis]|uniref:hypothetical protein n=1 Tax=Nonomuraea wenchangensis TaxID=568860 RepID=UPI00341626C6
MRSATRRRFPAWCAVVESFGGGAAGEQRRPEAARQVQGAQGHEVVGGVSGAGELGAERAAPLPLRLRSSPGWSGLGCVQVDRSGAVSGGRESADGLLDLGDGERAGVGAGEQFLSDGVVVLVDALVGDQRGESEGVGNALRGQVARFAELARAGWPGAGSYMGAKANIGL